MNEYECKICGRFMSKETDGNVKNTTGVCRLCHLESQIENLQKREERERMNNEEIIEEARKDVNLGYINFFDIAEQADIHKSHAVEVYLLKALEEAIVLARQDQEEKIMNDCLEVRKCKFKAKIKARVLKQVLV
jgi:hypothetical protein